MSKIFKLRILALTLYFYRDEGKRVHVHIAHKDGSEIKIWLDDFSIDRSTFKRSEHNDLIKIARKYEEIIRQAWQEAFEDSGEED